MFYWSLLCGGFENNLQSNSLSDTATFLLGGLPDKPPLFLRKFTLNLLVKIW